MGSLRSLKKNAHTEKLGHRNVISQLVALYGVHEDYFSACLPHQAKLALEIASKY